MFAAGSILALLLTGFAISGMAGLGMEDDETDTDSPNDASEDTGAVAGDDGVADLLFGQETDDVPKETGENTAEASELADPDETPEDDAIDDDSERTVFEMSPGATGEDGGTVATIAGFDFATDVLILDFHGSDADAPTITLDTETAPGDTLVQANGHTIVVLSGTAGTDPAAVDVVMTEPAPDTDGAPEADTDPEADPLPDQIDLDALLNGGTITDMLDARTAAAQQLETGNVDALTAGANGDSLTGSEGSEALFGSEGGDQLSGGGGNDELHGEDGDDALSGGADHDFLSGGDGADTLDGGTGNDLLFGGRDADLLQGGAGDDFLQGGFGADTMDGGAGNDVLDGTFAHPSDATGYSDADTGDSLSGGAGDDILLLGQNDVATGGDGADTFIGGATAAAAGTPGTVSDFVRGEDRIEVFFNPADNPDPDITVIDFEDGSGAHVLLDGQIVLNVAGAQGLDAAEVGLRPWA